MAALAMDSSSRAVQHGVVSFGKPLDKPVSIGQPGRSPHLLIGGVRLAVTDVFRHGAGE